MLICFGQLKRFQQEVSTLRQERNILKNKTVFFRIDTEKGHQHALSRSSRALSLEFKKLFSTFPEQVRQKRRNRFRLIKPFLLFIIW